MENKYIDYKFNINEFVKVRLTNKGVDFYKDYLRGVFNMINLNMTEYQIVELYKKNIDDDNYLLLQFWEFMQIFGKLGRGMDEYIELELIFNSKNLKPIQHRSVAVMCDNSVQFEKWKEDTFSSTNNDKSKSFISKNCKYYRIDNFNDMKGLIIDNYINLSDDEELLKFGGKSQIEVHLKSKCSSYL